MRKTLLLLATFALCLTALTSSGSHSSASPAPVRKGQKLHKKEKAIHGKYIVVLKDEATGEPGAFSQADQVIDVLVAAYDVKDNKRFKDAINGFAADMSETE